MGPSSADGAWQRWLRQPQRVWLRRAIFQIHLWSALALGAYIFFISLTGSVLVYRNELYVLATPAPIISESDAPHLHDVALTSAATSIYPEHRVTRIVRMKNPDQAVEVWLSRDGTTERRLFDPRSGEDVGNARMRAVEWVTTLIELHDDLLAGAAGRRLNALGALAVLLVALTGAVVWWPGIARWRLSIAVHRGVGWRRLLWELHSAIGFWTIGFVLVSGVSGLYLCVPELFHAAADWLQPPGATPDGMRFVDGVLYWLAYLHFGRINGIGIPCDGPGLCDQAIKASWALLGLAPAAMFVTGTLMWWNRVVRPALRKRKLHAARAAGAAR
jgi:uncharacterized iron-regulated membrane protein